MAKALQENSPEALSNVLASMESGREEALHAWKRTCTLYSKYFSALAKADSPGELMQANADLMTGTMEAFGRSAAGLLHISDAQMQKH